MNPVSNPAYRTSRIQMERVVTPKLYKEDGLPHIDPFDQVFTYNRTDTGEQLNFNVSLMDRLRKEHPNWFWKQELPLDDTIYDLVMRGRGVEEYKVERLTPEQVDEPGIGVLLNDDVDEVAPNQFVLVDGNHRLVKRFRAGLRGMDVWITLKPVWEVCLMHPADTEAEDFLNMLVPKMK